MAKKKEPAKPIFPLKHEFYDSLDNFIQKSMMMGNAIDTVLSVGKGEIPERFLKVLEDARAEYNTAWSDD